MSPASCPAGGRGPSVHEFAMQFSTPPRAKELAPELLARLDAGLLLPFGKLGMQFPVLVSRTVPAASPLPPGIPVNPAELPEVQGACMASSDGFPARLHGLCLSVTRCLPSGLGHMVCRFSFTGGTPSPRNVRRTRTQPSPTAREIIGRTSPGRDGTAGGSSYEGGQRRESNPRHLEPQSSALTD